jgi:hypothetical protein
MGQYAPLDEDLLLATAVRGGGNEKQLSPGQKARFNRLFNYDDIENLKDKDILGEDEQGKVAIVPKSLRSQASAQEDEQLADTLAKEENRDREAIVEESIQKEPKASRPELFRVLAESIFQASPDGRWFLLSGKWERKKGDKTADAN